mgnify:CR=1 FL=1
MQVPPALAKLPQDRRDRLWRVRDRAVEPRVGRRRRLNRRHRECLLVDVQHHESGSIFADPVSGDGPRSREQPRCALRALVDKSGRATRSQTGVPRA